MSWWRCEDCGLHYVSHPEECGRCESVRFSVYEPSTRERVLRPSVITTVLGLLFLLAVVYLTVSPV